MTLRGYRPDLPSQRRLMFASVFAVAFGGAAGLASGLLNHSTLAIAAGVFGLAAATFGLFVIRYRYPAGFELPSDVDPNNTKAVLTAVEQYKHNHEED